MKQQNNKAIAMAVNSLRIVVGEQSLLVPMSAVGEVVRGINVSSRKDDPECIHGWLQWRETELPLVAFEMMAGGEKAIHTGTVNALIVNTLGRAKGLDFYALLLTDLPQPARITEGSKFAEVVGQADENEYYLMVVELDGTEIVIPDLQSVEKFIRAKL